MADKKIECKELSWGEAKSLKRAITKIMASRQELKDKIDAAKGRADFEDLFVSRIMLQPEYLETTLIHAYGFKAEQIDAMKRKDVLAHMEAFIEANKDLSEGAEGEEVKKLNALFRIIPAI